MTRTVFYGFGAYVGSFSSATACAWWPADPGTLGFAPAQQVPVDLALCPQGVRNGTITQAAIQVDDSPVNGGLTKIGPLFPGGIMIGACWLEQNYWKNLPARGIAQPPRLTPQDQCRDYELTSVLDWDADRRFAGFYAEISGAQGSLRLVSVWNAGTSLVPGQLPAGTWWLDLSAVADPVANGFTTVANTGDKGALFLDVQTIRLLVLAGPKKPPITGHDHYFQPSEED